MTAQVHRIYDRKARALPSDNTLQKALKGAFTTAQVLTWAFLFAQGFKYLFLAGIDIFTKLFEVALYLQEFLHVS